jgi:hypothetical protein
VRLPLAWAPAPWCGPLPGPLVPWPGDSVLPAFTPGEPLPALGGGGGDDDDDAPCTRPQASSQPGNGSQTPPPKPPPSASTARRAAAAAASPPPASTASSAALALLPPPAAALAAALLRRSCGSNGSGSEEFGGLLDLLPHGLAFPWGGRPGDGLLLPQPRYLWKLLQGVDADPGQNAEEVRFR